MLQSTHDGNPFTRTRMQRVLDQNVKRLFLGSMSPSRRARCRNTSSACCASVASKRVTARHGVVRCGLPCRQDIAGVRTDASRSIPMRVSGAIRMVFAQYRALGSARQLFLWTRQAGVMLPVVQRNVSICKITWRRPAYHTVVPVVEGRARKTSGHDRPMSDWGALLRDNHQGYITWAEFEENQRMFQENAHMQKRTSRKAGRGG
jgi:hypothetical protein